VRVLITGHRGFVGRHFWRVLDEQGHDLTGIDITTPLGSPYLWGRTAEWRADARDYFRQNDDHFDLVIHLAAVVGGRATIEGAPLKVAVDLSIDAELFQWALRTRPGRIVYYSSSAAYPVGLQQETERCSTPESNGRLVDVVNTRRLREDDLRLDWIGAPDLTYGWAKLTGEMLGQHAEAEGLRVNVFRPFSGYGEDQALSYPFPAFIQRAEQRNDPFEVWGSGMQVRDWIHIDDVVAATLVAIDQDVPGPTNLCTGRPTSFLELADLVTKAAGYRPEIHTLPEAPTGVHYRVGDPGKLHTFYQPRISLEEGIQRALDTARTTAWTA
jgi:nucleoside-diphosphate-sugar epimerase